MLQTKNNVPEAFIALKGNRVKHYEGKVYLADGAHFELELFNPKRFPVLAKIKLNGDYISSSGLILRPGERFYLDRFLDKNEKFLFSTYHVDNSTEAKNAIALNGFVEVEFYDREIVLPVVYPVYPQVPSYPTQPWNGIFYNQDTIYRGGSPTTNPYTITCSTDGGSLSTTFSDEFSVSNNTTVESDLRVRSIAANQIETGRIEGGQKSKQKFQEVNERFEFFTCAVTRIQILPESQKVTTAVRNYCTKCGTRMKKTSWKFCPSCGNDLTK